MANSKLQEIPLVTLTSAGSLIGVRDNGDDTFTDIRVSAANLASFVLANGRKKITAFTANISNGGKTLTDPFFSNTIEEIVMNNQVYLKGDDYTQSDTAITMIDNGFIDGKNLIAKL